MLPRWGGSSAALDETMVHLLDGRVTLRSKTPDLVLQEFYALMIAHAAIRRTMVEAAGGRRRYAPQGVALGHFPPSTDSRGATAS